MIEEESIYILPHSCSFIYSEEFEVKFKIPFRIESLNYCKKKLMANKPFHVRILLPNEDKDKDKESVVIDEYMKLRKFITLSQTITLNLISDKR